MSGIIDELKLSAEVVEESPVPVSLEQLLLSSQLQEDLDTLEVNNNEPAEEEQPVSRKARRKKLKSNRVVSRKPGERQKKESNEQKRREKQAQEINRKALLDYQLQAKQRKVATDGEQFVGSITSSAEKSEVISRGKIIRPVVLGSIELIPTYDSSGLLSPAGRLLRLKRSVRRIKIDKIVKPRLKNQHFKGVPLAVALVDYLSAKRNFFNSLSPSNISMYDLALNAFELTMTKNVSNSETLYTLFHEYTSSLISGTAKLAESPPRSVDRGAELIDSKGGKIDDLLSALKNTGRSTFSDYYAATTDDIEISLKSLLAIFTKEIVYSFNTADSQIIDNQPMSFFRAVKKGDALVNPREYKSDSSMLGVVFKSIDPRRSSDATAAAGDTGFPIINYPFELTDIIAQKNQTKSSSGFVADLRREDANSRFSYPLLPVGKPPESVSSIYEAVSNNVASAASNLRNLATINNMDVDGSAYLYMLNGLVSKIKTRFDQAKSSEAACAEITFFQAAATNQAGFMMYLLVYLAFREQRMTGYDGTEKQPESANLIQSDHLLNVIAGVFGLGTQTRDFNINPQTINMTPGVDGQTTFSAPDTAQKASLEVQPESFQFGTLESKYSQSFEGLCDTLTNHIHSLVGGNQAPGKDFGVGSTINLYESSIKNALLDLEDENSLFNVALEYLEVINGMIPKNKDTISIFKEDYHRKTLFNGIPERNLHLAHVAIISKLVAVIADSKFVAVKESTPTGVTPAKTTQPTMSKAPASPQSTGTASAVSTSYGPMLSPLGGSAISAGSTNSMAALAGASTGVGMAANSISAAMDLLEHTDVYFTSDYTSSLMDLEAYLNSADSNDFTEILDSYPVLAAIGTALYEEDLFLSLFAESMSQYFAVIKRNYEVVNKTLDKVVAGKSLRQRTAEGLEPSDDLAKCLQSFSVSLNSPHMVYDGVKTRDHLIGPDSYAHLESQLKQKKYRSKKRIFGIGLPVSLLDSTESTPAEISEVRTNRRIEKKDTFKIVVQRIDQANPEIQYKDLTFSFSRSLFATGLYQDYMNSPALLSNAGFVKIHDDLLEEFLPRSSAEKLYPKDVVENHTTDLVLKQYVDLMADIDFSEYSFPSSKIPKKELLSSEIDISCFSSVDGATKKFLSGSNLAFDPKRRSIDNFDFYKVDPKNPLHIKLDVSSQTKNDNYTFSSFNYMNSYGSIFIPSFEEKRLEDGVDFEKVICLLIDDDDFEIAFEDKKERSSINSEIQSMIEYEKMQSLGTTSNGVDLNTYRFMVLFDDGSEV